MLFTGNNFLANFLKQELRRWKECQWKTQICQLFRDPAIHDQQLRDHDQRKTTTGASRNSEIRPFLQITISRKTYNFSRKSIQFRVIANRRNGPLPANHDRNKNYAVFRENYTVSRDRSLQKFTGTASDSLEK